MQIGHLSLPEPPTPENISELAEHTRKLRKSLGLTRRAFLAQFDIDMTEASLRYLEAKGGATPRAAESLYKALSNPSSLPRPSVAFNSPYQNIESLKQEYYAIDKQYIGQRINIERRRRLWGQQYLSKLANLTYVMIHDCEHGLRKPFWTSFLKLVSAFDMIPSDFYPPEEDDWRVASLEEGKSDMVNRYPLGYLIRDAKDRRRLSYYGLSLFQCTLKSVSPECDLISKQIELYNDTPKLLPINQNECSVFCLNGPIILEASEVRDPLILKPGQGTVLEPNQPYRICVAKTLRSIDSPGLVLLSWVDCPNNQGIGKSSITSSSWKTLERFPTYRRT